MFMLTGPATNIATLMVVKNELAIVLAALIVWQFGQKLKSLRGPAPVIAS
ncbi:hypothetical protein [Thalassotalea sp. ND16A]|nr:hypothetical protein [Thalassotalea sp. ND16A]